MTAILSGVRRLSSTSSTALIPTIDPAIQTLIRAREFPAISSLLTSRLSSAPPSEPHLASLILSASAANLPDLALHAFSSHPAPRRSPLSLNPLLSAFTRSRKHRRHVPHLFHSLSSSHSITPDHVTYSILIKSLCLVRGSSKALPVLKQMEAANIPVTLITYTTVLDSLYKDLKFKKASDLWEDMVQKGCIPDVAAYNARAQHAGPKYIRKLIKEMEGAGVKPDTITYNYLMASYCKTGKVNEAMAVYKGLGKKRCEGNTLTYQILLAFLCEKGEFHKAEKVFQDSLESGRVPDLGMVKRMVKGMVVKKKGAMAKRVVSLLRGKYPVEFAEEWKKIEKIVGLEMGKEVTE